MLGRVSFYAGQVLAFIGLVWIHTGLAMAVYGFALAWAAWCDRDDW